MVKYLIVLLVGMFLGVVGFMGWYIFAWKDAFAAPASQEVSPIQVVLDKLEAKDQWLATTTAYLTPVNEIWSNRKYAVLILVPPPDGVPLGPGQTGLFNLQAKNSDLIQPIQISATDFGANRKQIAVKLIDEGVTLSQAYQPSQELTITSAR